MVSDSQDSVIPAATDVVVTVPHPLAAFRATLTPEEADLWRIDPHSAEGRAILARLRRDRLGTPQVQEDFPGPR